MAAEPTTRDLKLIQYLNEAYGKEKQLETALKAHISMTTRDTYKKRLRDHLKETQQQAKGLERRIKQLGGKAEATDLPGPDVVAGVAGKGIAAAKKGAALAQGPLHAVRGTGEAEKQLKNAKTELANEFEEIGNYIAIEEFATAVKDPDTAKLARDFRRQEERMANFLQKLIPQLSKLAAREEVPAAERRGNGAATTRRSPASRATARAPSSNSRASGTTPRASGSGARASSSRASGASGSSSRASGSASPSSGPPARGSSRSSAGTRSTSRRTNRSGGNNSSS
jgi:ferritin-like metal-binding protein YciE